jgi:hypothetical protein
MRWSEDKLLEYKAKRTTINNDNSPPDEGREYELDKKIANYCKEHHYYAFHDYSRNVNKAGHPDWIIALPKGRVVFIENKSKKGKMSNEQKLVMVKLIVLGQEIYECRSYKKFLEIMLMNKGK